jgi:hypothetical protein
MKTIYIILLSLLFANCQEKHVSEQNHDIEKTSDDNYSVKIENDNYLCDCTEKNAELPQEIKITFGDNQNISESEEYKKWSNNSLRKKVTSISLRRFDSIPKVLSIFENVTKLEIESRDSLVGFDIFKNLKHITFWGSNIILNSNENFIKHLEVLTLEKSRISGVDSISKFSNLKILNIRHSGFHNCNMDIGKISCLRELEIRAYLTEELDLRKVDLSNLICLRKLYILDTYEKIKGIPRGISKLNLKKLTIINNFITQEEKELLKTLK